MNTERVKRKIPENQNLNILLIPRGNCYIIASKFKYDR